MARKKIATSALSVAEIVIRADAGTIKAALEARLKTDELLVEREQAYRRIAELEAQIEELMGEPGVFVYPEPPLPVAGFKTAAKSEKAATPSPTAKTAANKTATPAQ
ncbi:MAG: hypothetical protein GX946_03195 [Oligosphaeraceae bacterium]|nr:hypothetical protein [Oligosphaeraceae bacterium]